MIPDTDNAAVDAVLERLETVDQVELAKRLALFTDLQTALATVLDDDPAESAAG